VEDIPDSAGTWVADSTWDTREDAWHTVVVVEDRLRTLWEEGRGEDARRLEADTWVGSTHPEDVHLDTPWGVTAVAHTSPPRRETRPPEGREWKPHPSLSSNLHSHCRFLYRTL